MTALWLAALAAGVGLVVGGSELFAEHLSVAALRLGVSTFALGLLLAGAEPEELATVVTAGIRHAPGIAFGDVVGANVAMCLAALGVGALVAPLHLSLRVFRYALGSLVIGVIAVAIAWDGRATRPEGAVLVGLYAAYVAVIWRLERRPPVIGEATRIGEVGEVAARSVAAGRRRVGWEPALAVAGVGAMAVGALVLVEAVKRLTDAEDTQTRLGVTLVGFVTAFELVVLAWSAARRGATEALLAGVVGSFAYNATMTLGAGALARPLVLADPGTLRLPLALMPAALLVPLVLSARRSRLGRGAGVALVALYAAFVAVVLVA